MSESVKKVLSVIASVLLWAVIILAAFFSFATLATHDPNNISNFLGYTPMSVQTDSMSPTFNAGDLIVIKQCDPVTLQVGDIVTFHTIIENQYALNTHRIVEIEESGGFRFYTTKGDNNLIADSDTVSNGDIVGKYVFRIPFLGSVMNFLQSKIGFLICILLPMLGFFIYQVYNLVQVAIKYKKAVALEAAEEAARATAKIQAEEAEKLAQAYPGRTGSAETQVEMEARIRAEVEARLRAETEAKGKSEAEAQAETEAKEKAKAEADAKLREEAKAYAQAQLEAAKKAEAAKEAIAQAITQTAEVPAAKEEPAAPSSEESELERMKRELEEAKRQLAKAEAEKQAEEAAKAAKRAKMEAAKKAKAEMIAAMKAEAENNK